VYVICGAHALNDHQKLVPVLFTYALSCRLFNDEIEGINSYKGISAILKAKEMNLSGLVITRSLS